ncbi:MAG: hypothetical protein QM820_33920 [Minicystis sp.]
MRRAFFSAVIGLAALCSGSAAFAGPPGSDAVAPEAPRPTDARVETPVLGFAQNAFGASRMTAGALGYVGMLYGQPNPAGDPGAGKLLPQGGARIWGSPVDRLTFLLEVDKRDFASAAPSATIAVRILGSRADGWALGAAATYRAEGFAHIVGEMEGALLLSFARRGFYADLNGVFGAAFAEKEMDSEVKLRLGYDVTPWLRIGADSRFRMRVGGGKYLAGGRSFDAIGGPELVFGYKHFFGALSGGPSTVGVARGFGWGGTTTFGAAWF